MFLGLAHSLMKPHWKLPGNLDDFNKANENIIPTLNKSTQILEGEGAMSEAKRIMARSRLGGGKNKAFNFFINNKKSIYGTGAGILAAGTGYYMYGKHKEEEMYDETLEQQPSTYKPSNGEMMQSTGGFSSYRRDPLGTAGVVGNLDRSKIGHYSMGPKKYDHLFGG